MELLNEKPLVELSFSDEYGDEIDVDFRVEVGIENTENKIVNDLHKTIEDVTGLATDKEDYLQVFI